MSLSPVNLRDDLFIALPFSYRARIVLHDPCTDLSDANDISARTILESANAILDSIRAISDTPLDFSTMYHGTSVSHFFMSH